MPQLVQATLIAQISKPGRKSNRRPLRWFFPWARRHKAAGTAAWGRWHRAPGQLWGSQGAMTAYSPLQPMVLPFHHGFFTPSTSGVLLRAKCATQVPRHSTPLGWALGWTGLGHGLSQTSVRAAPAPATHFPEVLLPFPAQRLNGSLIQPSVLL